MKLTRILLTLLVVASLAGFAYVGQIANESIGASMEKAASKLLGTLSDEQKAKAAFAFDSKERTNWNFIPLQDKDKKTTRKGLPLEDMSAEQKKLTLDLLATGTSESGFKEATTIMSLEGILRDLEKSGAMVRKPDWYFVSIYGTPAKTGKWGWRLEGHHLSLNFTIENGEVIAATPTFFGANPATVMAGGKKGLRTLVAAEDQALALFKALDDDQKKVALQGKHFPEPKQGTAFAGVGAPVGLVAAKMNEKQRGMLEELIVNYANRLKPELAKQELDALRAAGLEKVHFAFTGEAASGQPHSYRIQGPKTFVIEFLNVQADSANNPANHIHSNWRKLDGDFGVTKK